MIISHENHNHHYRLLLMLALLGFSLFAAVGTANAGALLASWDANSESDLAGYKVYYGKESGNYSHIQDVGNQTSFLAENLDDGQEYYFAVTAYDLVGNESEFSDEVHTTVAMPTLLIAHTSNGVELNWSPVSGADHYDIYRTTEAYTNSATPSATVSATHYVDANHPIGEAKGTFYVVKAKKADGSVLSTFNQVGAFDLDLQRGLNLVSLPVIPGAADVTSVLGDALAGGQSSATSDQIWIWRPQSQDYQVIWLAEGFDNSAVDGNWFDSETMQKSNKELDNINAFWVKVLNNHQSTSLTVTGAVPQVAETSIGLHPGLNFVGSIYPKATTVNGLGMYEDQVVAGAFNMNVADIIMDWIGDQYSIAFLADGTNTPLDGKWMNESGSAQSEMQFQPGHGYVIWIRGERTNDTWTFTNPGLE